ncbi:MAG: PorT family protein [Bacteroidales bacterium]|nr:PorT family protein [Bacteroidales bacterium]
MKKAIIAILFSMLAFTLRGQELPDFPDTIRTDFPVEYLDTVVIRKQEKINDYSMIGVSYGVTLSRQNFNPSKEQSWLFTPFYASVLFSHYEKMFDYLPYFGYQIGFAYSREGYRMKIDPKTGRPYDTIRGAESVRYDVVELPFMIQAHYDAQYFRLLLNIGAYGGYRLAIHRQGPWVDPELAENFAEEDRRFDYGLQAGAGFALVFEPFEFHFSVLGRYGLSTLWVPNLYQGIYDKYYYKFANPIDLAFTFGIHFQLGNRMGKTRRELHDEAYEIVYGKKYKR